LQTRSEAIGLFSGAQVLPVSGRPGILETVDKLLKGRLICSLEDDRKRQGQSTGILPVNLSRPVQRAGQVLGQGECGTRILRVVHGRDARATSFSSRLRIARDAVRWGDPRIVAHVEVAPVASYVVAGRGFPCGSLRIP